MSLPVERPSRRHRSEKMESALVKVSFGISRYKQANEAPDLKSQIPFSTKRGQGSLKNS